MTTSPTIGTFIRPAGRYKYCLEVLRVLPADDTGPEQWQCRRWGLSADKCRPVDDGHCGEARGMSYLNDLKYLRPGCWKDEWLGPYPRWNCVPLYWLRMDFSGHQESLF